MTDDACGSSGGRKDQRFRKRRKLDLLVRDLTPGPNCLYAGHVYSFNPLTEEKNAVQRLATDILRGVGEEAFCRRYFDAETSFEADDEGLEYGDLQSWVWLNPDRISLPVENLAASADILPLMPENIQGTYAAEGHVLRPPFTREKLGKPFCSVRQSDYVGLVMMLEKAGLVTLRKKKPKTFRTPPEIELPNPGHLARLHLPAGKRLFVGKSDMDNQYHRMKLPDWMNKYFGLPPIALRGSQGFSMIRSMPMRWSHSVFMPQTIHRKLLEHAGLSSSLWILDTILIPEFSFGAYIDD
ncbi:hypothetical protein FGB62_378g01 [Gracilaria domingensis]|nr:hypothetical protein FGB62_378g01 [Gracilaria domingensis]